MTFHEVLLNANAVVARDYRFTVDVFQRSAAIVLYLPGMPVRFLSSTSIPFRIWAGQLTQVDFSELILNSIICIVLWRANGNIAGLAVRS